MVWVPRAVLLLEAVIVPVDLRDVVPGVSFQSDRLYGVFQRAECEGFHPAVVGIVVDPNFDSQTGVFGIVGFLLFHFLQS